MTLDLLHVAAALPRFVEDYAGSLSNLRTGLDRADAALATWSADPLAAEARIRSALAGSAQPFALHSAEAPDAVFDPPPFAPVTVVAADGSSIDPDRFAPVQCFVINVGAAVLPYGLPGEPDLSAVSHIGPRSVEDGGEDDGSEFGGRGLGVNLRRDVSELEQGAGLAIARLEHGPVVFLIDGTLLPWDLDSRQVNESVRIDLAGRTLAALDALAASGPALSIGAYISGSRASDLANSLRALAGPGAPAPISDAHILSRRLADGQRSAVFRAASDRPRQIESEFAGHSVCFFYLRTGGDIARVEMPSWVADDPARVDRLHATLVHQCERCGGYPRALQEAHEQAVISGRDRDAFTRLLENEADRFGLRPVVNGKAMSKRRRAL